MVDTSKMENVIELNKDKKVYISEMNGKKYVHLRTFFKSDKGEVLPTKKGFAWPLEDIETLQTAIQNCIDGNVPSELATV